MATSNDINTSGIDTTYPVPGQDNDSQGFRDNFSNIKQALDDSKGAIQTLEGTSATGLTADATLGINNFNDKLISKAILRDTALSAPSAETISGETNVDYQSGHYRRLILTTVAPDNNVVTITNWSPSESMGHMTLEVLNNSSNVGDEKTLTFTSTSGNIRYSNQNILVNAGSFINGQSYKIIVPGDTSFTSIGSPSNTAGETFTATGAGTGTGVASATMLDGNPINIGVNLKYMFDVWSPNQGTDVFVYFKGVYGV